MDSSIDDLVGKIAKALSSKVNIQILQLLSSSKLYPREIARILGKDESEVSRRLSQLKRLGLIECSWERIGEKNVKLCHSLVKKVSFEFTGGTVNLNISTMETNLLINNIPKYSYSTDIPVPRYFVGRTQYLKYMEEAGRPVIVIWGLPGAGKTYLAARHVIGKEKPVFWYTSSPLSDIRHFIWRLVLFLNTFGYSEPANMMRSQWSPQMFLDLIVRGIEELEAIIVVDDYQKIKDQQLVSAVEYIASKIEKGRLIITSRNKPKGMPYLKGKVLEIKLGGMKFDEVVEYMNLRNILLGDKELIELYVATQGIPALIALYCEVRNRYGATDLAIFRRRNIITYIVEELYSSFSDDEHKIFDLLVLIDEPLGEDDLLEITGLKNVKYILKELLERGIIEYLSNKKYVIHDLFKVLKRKMPPNRVRALYSLIASYYAKNNNPYCFYRALLYYKRARDYNGIRKILQRRIYGDLEYHMYYLDKYLALLREIEKEAIDLRLKKLIEYEIGHMEYLRGNYDTAIDRLTTCLNYIDFSVSDEEKYLYIHTLIDLAESYIYKGLFDSASKLVDELSNIIDSLNNVELSRIVKIHYLGLLGLYYYYKRDYKKALDAYLERLKIASLVEDPKYYVSTLIGVANLYETFDEYEKALNILQDLYEYLTKAGDIVHKSYTGLILADVLAMIGRYKDSLRYLDEAIQLFKKMSRLGKLADAYMLKAYCELMLGNYEEALVSSDKSLEILGDSILCDKVHPLLVKVNALIKIGRKAEALELFNKDRELIDKCRGFGIVDDLLKEVELAL